jgi:hypothetical protein
MLQVVSFEERRSGSVARRRCVASGDTAAFLT